MYLLVIKQVLMKQGPINSTLVHTMQIISQKEILSLETSQVVLCP